MDSLLGQDKSKLAESLQRFNQPAFRARQLYGWIYGRGRSDFQDMANLPAALRAELTSNFTLARPKIVNHFHASDDTQKWLVGFEDGSQAETVFIPEERRGTLCISSQVGCTLTCKFCHTGTQKWVRNLTAGEIVGQLMLARDKLDDWHKTEDRRQITNVVMMGMGEPLFNTDSVIEALKLMTDGEGLSLSRRRVTLSTAGVAPEIPRVGQETGVALAISLHAVDDELRNHLVPINRKYPLAALMESIRNYPGLSNARRVTFEYIMLDGVNDQDETARRLVRLIKGIPSKINLIPFNPWPGSDFAPSDDRRIESFASILRKAGYTATVRRPRGQNILAACGQLKSESLRQNRKNRHKQGTGAEKIYAPAS